MLEKTNPFPLLLKRLQEVFQSDFIQKIVGTLGTRLVLILITLLTSVFTARLLGPEGRGQFALAVACTGFGVQLGNMGLQVSNTYFIAKKQFSLPLLLGNSIFISLFLGLIISIVFWVSCTLYPSLTPTSTLLTFFIILSIPLGIFSLLIQNLLIGTHKIHLYNRIELYSKILPMLLLVACLYFHVGSVNVVFFLTLLVFIISIMIGWHKLIPFSESRSLKLSFSALMQMIPFSLKSYFSALFYFFFIRTDLFIVKKFLSHADVGYYSLAQQVGDMVYLLPTVIAMILFPKLTAITDEKERWSKTKKVTFTTFVTLLVGVLILNLLMPFMVKTLYGPLFIPAVLPIQIYCLSKVLLGTTNIIAQYVASTGESWASCFIWLLTAIVNIICNLYLIPIWGINGATLSAIISCLFILVVLFIFVKKRSKTIIVGSLG